MIGRPTVQPNCHYSVTDYLYDVLAIPVNPLVPPLDPLNLAKPAPSTSADARIQVKRLC